ncbi:hypothetical protein BOTBODRAFT_33929 [Botryobasidium botryosum FD-172 SS1]|uniref:DUF7330 domain-containing protein n=1 Tax=Botryobasidium botryosum (strain FD-172 SS1) TaxID=930990 RepID=A0A067MBV7_BOTB1|nr:hypothetical protein BOTBODRAFT_33929 [Botryobasidium botryosum FD-172 SS1]
MIILAEKTASDADVGALQPPPRHPSVRSRQSSAQSMDPRLMGDNPPSYATALAVSQPAGPSSRQVPPPLPPSSMHKGRPSEEPPVSPKQFFPSQPIPIPQAVGNSTNNLCITTRKEPISGAFRIDPMICSPEILSKGRKKGRKKRHQRKWADDEKLNALFESKTGSIALGLGIVGTGGQGRGATAKIDARTRKGNVDIDLSELHSGRHVSLDVMTRKGDIRLFVPPNFRGIVNLYSKKGDLKILPGLARTMRVLSAKPEEMLIMIGTVEGLPSSANANTWEGDFAQLVTRDGHVTVGVYGDDKVPATMPWWKRVVSVFASSSEKDT